MTENICIVKGLTTSKLTYHQRGSIKSEKLVALFLNVISRLARVKQMLRLHIYAMKATGRKVKNVTAFQKSCEHYF